MLFIPESIPKSISDSVKCKKIVWWAYHATSHFSHFLDDSLILHDVQYMCLSKELYHISAKSHSYAIKWQLPITK